MNANCLFLIYGNFHKAHLFLSKLPSKPPAVFLFNPSENNSDEKKHPWITHVFFKNQPASEIENYFFNFFQQRDHLIYLKTLQPLNLLQEEAASLKEFEHFFQSAKKGIDRRLQISRGDPTDNLTGFSNLIKNAKSIYSSPAFDQLKNLFSGKPGFLLASGPSLSKAYPFIQEFQDKAILACASSNAKQTVALGIEPDFICVKERHSLHAGLLQSIQSKAYLVSLALVDPLTIKAYPGEKIFILRKHSFFKWFPAPFAGHEFGTSSALLTFYLLDFMGCNPIYLFGQDLAYDPLTGLTHAQGADTPRESINKLKTVKRILVPGNSGSPIETSPLWFRFLTSYQRLIQQSHKTVINVIDAPYGAVISGTQRLGLDEAIQQIEKLPSLKEEPLILSQTLKPLSPSDQLFWMESLKTKSLEAHDYLQGIIPLLKEWQNSPTLDSATLYYQYHQILNQQPGGLLLHDMIYSLDLDLMTNYHALGLSYRGEELEKKQKNLLKQGLALLQKWAELTICTLRLE